MWSITERRWIARNTTGGHTGTLHAIGSRVLALYEHPRLLDPITAAVIDTWPSLATGTQTSSFLLNQQPVPPVAIDATNSRFAIANDNIATVIQVPPTGT